MKRIFKPFAALLILAICASVISAAPKRRKRQPAVKVHTMKLKTNSGLIRLVDENGKVLGGFGFGNKKEIMIRFTLERP